MLVRLSTAIAAICMLCGAALAQGAAPTDPQIAHIAYTAGQLDIRRQAGHIEIDEQRCTCFRRGYDARPCGGE